MSLHESIRIPEGTLKVWQFLLDVMAEKFIVPAALIMKVDLPDIKVSLSSNSKGNPYKVGDSESLIGSGLYCETVLKTESKLLVPNALKDEKWDKNPDIKLNMISYIGFPILWPNKEVYGTICLLDSKENPFDSSQSHVLGLFKGYIEDYLSLKTSQFFQKNKDEILEKERNCDNSLAQIEKILYGKIISK